MPQLIDDPNWPRASAWLAGEHSARARGTLAVIGAPAGRGSITPGRCDLAPAAMRAALRRFSTYDLEADCDLMDIAARDHGDLDVAALGPEESFEPIRAGVSAAAQDASAVLILGGDNSITRAGVHAMGPDLWRCGLLTFDAHFDLRDTSTGLTNGNPVRALLADGLPGRNIVQLGLQPFANSRAYTDVAKTAGITLLTAGELVRRGVEESVNSALSQLSERCDAIYVDFDIDVLDRAFAPACPGSRPGGITPAQLRDAARLCGTCPKVRAADFVEVDPEQDVANTTLYAACLCLLGFASGVVRRRG